MGARAAGATTVVAVDVDADRLALARRLGATHAIDGSSGSIGGGDTVEQLLALVPGGVPWVVEAVGRPETLASAVAMLQQGGTAVAVGLGRVGQSVGIPVNDLVQKQKRVVGSLYGSSIPQLDLPRIFELYRRGALPLDELVGERFALEDIGAAFEALEHGSVGRSIVVPAREGVR
jgi:Zn-dependent alcohol dehydrogenase